MKSRKKIVAAVIMAIAIFTGIVFWQATKEVTPVPRVGGDEKKLSIITTFYPLQDFAESVGGDMVTVKSIVPSGTEPHDYEPTSQDIVSIYQADIFLLNGAGIDAWAEKIRPELEKRGVTVIQMSEALGVPENGGQRIADPHFWLDPVWAQKEIEALRNTFALRDPSHTEVYARNADRYIVLLTRLDTAYREGLRQCNLHTIVTSHDAFSYLAKRYGFEAISVSGISPEAEPSPRTLARIVEMIRPLGVRYIFFETLASPKIAETLAREIGAETLAFDPLEGLTEEDRQAGKDYLSVMQENLNNLQLALQCQK